MSRLVKLAPTAVLGFLPALFLIAACNHTSSPPVCTLEARAGINVAVVDDAMGQPIATATGNAREGDFVESLQSIQGAELFGVFEREGTYEVTVSAPGYQTWRMENVTVRADECHVIPVRLTAALEPVS